jgi:hypothetical protein
MYGRIENKGHRFVETHAPLARKLPGVKASSASFDAKPLGPGKAPYFCVFEADVESEAALMNALGIEGGSGGCGRRAQLRFRRRHHGPFPGRVVGRIIGRLLLAIWRRNSRSALSTHRLPIMWFEW